MAGAWQSTSAPAVSPTEESTIPYDVRAGRTSGGESRRKQAKARRLVSLGSQDGGADERSRAARLSNDGGPQWLAECLRVMMLAS